MALNKSLKNQAAWLKEAKGSIEVGPSEISEPGEGEVLIRVQAVPIQPVDAKIAKIAILKLQYPTVLGSTAAGTIEAVGKGVTKFKVGDRVAGGTNIYPTGGISKYGCQQRFVLAEAREVIDIGDVDFGTAASVVAQTPPSALFADSALGIQKPVDPLNPKPNGKKILIWGGSSAMGALSITYAKQAGCTVISTSSPHNFGLLKELGADYIFDYSDQSTVQKIQDLFPIDYWFDTISLPNSLSSIIKILSLPGKEVVKAEVLMLLPPSMPGMPPLPEGVTAKMHFFRNKAPENAEFMEWLMGKGDYLGNGLRGGWIKGVPVEKVGGLKEVEKGIERMYHGVSGRKLVVEPWKE